MLTDSLINAGFRTPDWRWLRAQALRAAGFRARATDASLIAAARSWQAGLAWARTDSEKRNLSRRWPDLSAAHALYETGGVVRDEIDARVLANQPVEEIAALTAVSADVIRIYEQLFWDVRSAVIANASDWLLGAVGIGSCTAGTVQERHVWQYAALSGGRRVLDLLIADHLGRRGPVLEERHKRAEGVRLCVRAYTLPWSPRSEAIAVLEAFTPLCLEAFDNTAQTPQEWQLLRCELRFLRRSYGLVGLPRKPKPLGEVAPAAEKKRELEPKPAIAKTEEVPVAAPPDAARTARWPLRRRSTRGRGRGTRTPAGRSPARLSSAVMSILVGDMLLASRKPDVAEARAGCEPIRPADDANER